MFSTKIGFEGFGRAKNPAPNRAKFHALNCEFFRVCLLFNILAVIESEGLENGKCNKFNLTKMFSVKLLPSELFTIYKVRLKDLLYCQPCFSLFE